MKWFNPEKGFGFVEMTDGSGEAFLHIRAVEAAGHSELPPGSKLVVRIAQSQKGPQVTEISSVDTSTAEPSRGGGGFRGGPRPGGGFGGGAGGGFRGAPQRRAPQPTGPAQDLSGTVKWYDPKKGFGFIAVEDGGKDVFIHRSALDRAGMQSLQEGERVTVSVVEGQKGREVQALLSVD